MVHMLSVDVEEYFQVEAFRGVVDRKDWDSFPVRVTDNVSRILDLFDSYGVKATFFFLGWVAARFPQLIRETARRGHEVGCHSFWHRTVFSLDPAEFRNDTRRAKEVIEQAAGCKVIGYRAPSWSVTSQSLWALDILAEEGFSYDSSIFPIHHDVYGIPGAKRFAHLWNCSSGAQLPEIPPTTVQLGPMNVPAAGGGYLRLFPLAFTRWAFRQMEDRERQPVVVYFHPWEIDPQQPRIRGCSLRSRLRHYTNLDKMEGRLRFLLSKYRFQPMKNALGALQPQLPEAAALGS